MNSDTCLYSSCSNGHQRSSMADLMVQHIKDRRIWFSLEFFLPYTDSGSEDLIGMIDYFVARKPLFYSIVSRCTGSLPCSNKVRNPRRRKITNSMDMADVMLNFCAVETVLHVCWQNETRDRMKENLEQSAANGVRTLFIVRGDYAIEHKSGDCIENEQRFTDTIQFIRFIKEEFGDQFCIGVPGYPEGHPDSKSYNHCLNYLRSKVEAGADFIISQIFFRAETFVDFLRDCRSIGIKCPIIPTILPISNYNSFCRIMQNSRLEVPSDISEALSLVKNDDESVQRFGVDLATNICRILITSNLVFGFHFCTLNRRTAVSEVLDRIGLVSGHSPMRELPWRQSAKMERRESETVRPIFWSVRPKSYMYRSSTWEQFPNGRWGNPSMACFRIANIDDHYLSYHRCEDEDLLRKQWGLELKDESDIRKMFVRFISGEIGEDGKRMVHVFPWSDEKCLAQETLEIIDDLIRMNESGILTINSQPNVNAALSNDPVHGWGPPEGYVYQKAYLEFFMPKKLLGSLLCILRQYTNVSYHIVDKSGHDSHTNHVNGHSIAVTWGVFRGREVVQPTVVDATSFLIWKDEAYSIWLKRWGSLYDADSKSYELLKQISESHFLVNLVDNDFVKRNCLFELIDKALEYEKRSYNAQQIFAV